MPGKGKYTEYVPVAPKRKIRSDNLQKLFPGNDNAKPPFYGFATNVGAGSASEAMAKRGNQFIFAIGSENPFVEGDPNIGKFYPDFSGAGASVSAPNKISFDGKVNKDSFGVGNWEVQGDPANPFVPNLMSPGPISVGTGNLEDGLNPAVNVYSSEDKDPGISTELIKPGMVLGVGGTRDPYLSRLDVHASITLGNDYIMGSSSPNSKLMSKPNST